MALNDYRRFPVETKDQAMPNHTDLKHSAGLSVPYDYDDEGGKEGETT